MAIPISLAMLPTVMAAPATLIAVTLPTRSPPVCPWSGRELVGVLGLMFARVREW